MALALASICLGHDDAKAAELFAPLASRYDTREAWVGLAIARRNMGDLGGAAGAVRSALCRHVPDDSLAGIADVIARQLDLPGWCGVTVDGVLEIRLTGGGQRVELEIDAQKRRPLTAGTFRLPRAWWTAARTLCVTDAGSHLLGSPIQAANIRRVDGCVASRDGGLDGWAWHPADPAVPPLITISAASGEHFTLIARDENGDRAHTTLLGRPRRFFVASDRLAGMTGPFHLTGSDDRDLFGSPLDPFQEQREAVAAARALEATFPSRRRRNNCSFPALPAAVPAYIKGPSPPIGGDGRRRTADVVIPIHGGGAIALACLETVLATVAPPSRIVIVDDATPDSDLAAALTALARRRRIRLIRHSRSIGYPGSANEGIRACAGRDVVLLNSDTLLPPHWLERLRTAAYSAVDIGTVSPLSNNATILSYPRCDESSPMPDTMETARLAALAHRANAAGVVDIPVAVGFCMYVRRDCLDAVGVLREDVFAQGYGEENDFCLRARHLGWRHVAAPGAFVAHRGAQSFGSAGAALRARNETLLNRLHPGYADLVLEHLRSDPLMPARRRLDQARWRAVRPARRVATLLITHNEGGGVEQCVAASCASHARSGVRPIVLRPAALPDGTPAVRLDDGKDAGFPNLRFAMPSELATLAKFLLSQGLREVELHHLAGHQPAALELIKRLGLPYDVHLHDYALLCPRMTLVGRERRYCGEPAIAACEACIADLGSYSAEAISVAALRLRSRQLLARARNVIAPSADTAERVQRYFPEIAPQVLSHENDDTLAATPLQAVKRRAVVRVCVVGAVGVDKGFEILLACARDAAERALALEFVVVGHTIDDGRLLDTGRVFVTGEFQPGEAIPLIRAQNANLAWLPSVWPETWCFTLSEAWRAGLRVVAFDLGAQAERVRRTGRGVLLPLGLPPPAINSALLAAAGLPDH